jgi:hypothetical protein
MLIRSPLGLTELKGVAYIKNRLGTNAERAPIVAVEEVHIGSGIQNLNVGTRDSVAEFRFFFLFDFLLFILGNVSVRPSEFFLPAPTYCTSGLGRQISNHQRYL